MIAQAGVPRFRRVLAARLGWNFDDNDAGHLGQVLGRRAEATGYGTDVYLDRLGTGDWDAETTVLAELLTINETYFFRHAEQFRALAEVALPERIRDREAHRVLRMLSVGCSSGEEAYTLAIVGRTVQRDPGWTVSVLGLDASPAVLARAEAARYSAWSLRETPDGVRQRWFRPDDSHYVLDERIRRAVRFKLCNVAEADDPVWRPGQYDVVFCRNLLMYLTPEVQAGLIRRMTDALAPGGFLFLGHTDTLGSRPEGLEPQHTHGTFYYRRGASGAPAPRREPVVVHTPVIEPPEPEPDRRTYDRAYTLLRDERFTEALAVLVPRDRRDHLLRGVLLVQAGRLDEAETDARRLVASDGLDPDAHQLLGVCAEGRGADAVTAAEQYRLAAYLDTGFAMPRLRLGLLARRRGDNRSAAGELEQALVLLNREREDRIVLFGGGFGRVALATLCRTELDACGVRR
ncbi:CheR family methyltransferase [Symbioplanes lichenis]|uniref:CheR family methyltransferase n=1 Tax=Symbioplanes lichenis TaxID=1629072 RepID=UPI002739D4E0|nr:protein-glutamate O-methyltransferase CheR [Actinoplanes lichenis]